MTPNEVFQAQQEIISHLKHSNKALEVALVVIRGSLHYKPNGTEAFRSELEEINKALTTNNAEDYEVRKIQRRLKR